MVVCPMNDSRGGAVVGCRRPERVTACAIGLVRTDISRNPTYDMAQIRLTALAQGYRIAHILVTDEPSIGLLLAAIGDVWAEALFLPHDAHLPDELALVLGVTCPVISCAGPDSER